MTVIKINKDFIYEYMERNNIKSLNVLAREIGISAATLSRIFSGERNPGQLVIGRMLAYFDVKFEELFTYDKELTNVNDKKTVNTA